MPAKRNDMTPTDIEKFIAQQVTDALAAQEINRNSRDLPNGDSNTAGGGEYTIHFVVQLKKMMTAEYCHRNEVQKLEAELWNLTVKGTDIARYTKHFQELALLCSGMVPYEEKMIERNNDNKRKREDDQGGNSCQQQNKSREVVRVYVAAAESSDKKGYAGTLPL
ncbi:reverse transcriptase domain-containing protein, partial [Tanacetum coccineum]